MSVGKCCFEKDPFCRQLLGQLPQGRCSCRDTSPHHKPTFLWQSCSFYRKIHTLSHIHQTAQFMDGKCLGTETCLLKPWSIRSIPFHHRTLGETVARADINCALHTGGWGTLNKHFKKWAVSFHFVYHVEEVHCRSVMMNLFEPECPN